MSSGSWSSPVPLYVDDLIDVMSSDGSGWTERMRVKKVHCTTTADFYICTTTAGYEFTLPSDATQFDWRRVAGEDTKPSFLAAAPVFGAVCTRCRELFEHAENKPNFVCYGCRSWS